MIEDTLKLFDEVLFKAMVLDSLTLICFPRSIEFPNTKGGLMTRTIPVMTKIAQSNLYNPNLSFRKISKIQER